MKILILNKISFAILMTCIVANSYSQKVYFNFAIGNNYNAASGFRISENTDIITSNITGNYITGVNNNLKETISFGEGFQFGGTIGYMPSKILSFELSINFLKGNEYEDKYTERHEFYSDVYTQKYRSQMLRFSPTIRLSTGNSWIKPYLKTGLVIGVGSKINVEELYVLEQMTQETEFEFKGGISIGYAAGIGINIETDKRIGFFSEINIITQSWAPERLSYTKFKQNYIDVLELVPVNVRETVFVDSYSSDVPTSNTISPSEKLKTYFPFSSIGWNIGIYLKI